MDVNNEIKINIPSSHGVYAVDWKHIYLDVNEWIKNEQKKCEILVKWRNKLDLLDSCIVLKCIKMLNKNSDHPILYFHAMVTVVEVEVAETMAAVTILCFCPTVWTITSLFLPLNTYLSLNRSVFDSRNAPNNTYSMRAFCAWLLQSAIEINLIYFMPFFVYQRAHCLRFKC